MIFFLLGGFPERVRFFYGAQAGKPRLILRQLGEAVFLIDGGHLFQTADRPGFLPAPFDSSAAPTHNRRPKMPDFRAAERNS